MNENRLILLREGRIPKVLLKLGLPSIIGMLTGALYNVVDAYFIGGLGTARMGAVSVVFPLVMILIGIGLTFGSGAGSYISRMLGEGNAERAHKTASTAVISGTITGIVVIILLLLNMTRVLKALGATETILPYARQYALIYLSGGVMQVFIVIMNNIAISEGASKAAMTSQLLSVGLNCILDPVFIYTLGLGIRGAAAATLISQAAALVFYIRFIAGRKGFLEIKPGNFSRDRTIIREILKVGIPVLMLQIATSLSIALTNASAKDYGDSAVAAMGVVSRVCTLGAYAVFGYVKGFQPLAGYSFGAGNYKRLKKAVNISLLWTSLYCGIIAAVMIIFPGPVIRLFSRNDTEMISIGTAAVRANGIIFWAFGFQMVYSTLFLSFGRAAEGGILSMSRQGIFFIPAVLILPLLAGLDGIIYAQMAADVLSVFLTAVLAVRLHKELNKRMVKEKGIETAESSA